MYTIQLTDPEIFPTPEVLKTTLGGSYPAYERLTGRFQEYGLDHTWNYYKDGKAWLCKVIYKKKTVFWLSAWDGYFKTTFYFTEKTAPGIDSLEIQKSIKNNFHNAPHIGKLIPLTMEFGDSDLVEDFYRIVAYKKSLK